MTKVEKLRCWVCQREVTSDKFNEEAGQCKDCEARNPMPECMKPGFRWPIHGA